MRKFFSVMLIAGSALMVAPNPSVSQCSNRVVLADSTYIRCGGITYSNCVVELAVNSSGLWVNGNLVVPFVSFVDALSDSSKDYYRATNAYKRATKFGATDGQGLLAATNAELLATRRLRKLTAGVKSAAELQSIKSAVFADSLIADFNADVLWASELERIGFKDKTSDTFVILESLCGAVTVSARNPRDWDEYLPYLMETYCGQIEGAKRLETVEKNGSYLAYILGRVSGHAGYKSKAELLKELEKY